MTRLIACLKLDMKLQARNQLYSIGLFVALLLGVMARFLVPVEYLGRGLPAFYVLGLGGTTFMFGSSMLLLEKGEHTLQALRTSMITTQDYVLSKAITLTTFALVESAIVYTLAARGTPTNLVWLVLGALVLGVFYTFVGLGMAAPYEVVTTFLLPNGAFVAMVLQLPFLSLIDVGPWWLWYLIPTQAPLLLLLAAFEPLQAWQWAYALTMSTAMVLASYAWCRDRFRTWIGLPEAA